MVVRQRKYKYYNISCLLYQASKMRPYLHNIFIMYIKWKLSNSNDRMPDFDVIIASTLIDTKVLKLLNWWSQCPFSWRVEWLGRGWGWSCLSTPWSELNMNVTSHNCPYHIHGYKYISIACKIDNVLLITK